MLKIALLLVPALLSAQTSPSFEVATIKPSDAVKNAGLASGWSLSIAGNGLKIIGTLRTFIRVAWDIEDVQIAGGPAWLDKDMYEVNGKAASAATRHDLELMLQSLLAERFKLVTHREARQLPVYSMILAKGGSRLQRVDANLPLSSSTGATFVRGRMDSTAFAAHLTAELHRTIIDNTGLQGNWNFDLSWAPDDVTTGPSLFTAIQEQLGLKLEATKGPVQVLVVDSADKPSDN